MAILSNSINIQCYSTFLFMDFNRFKHFRDTKRKKGRECPWHDIRQNCEWLLAPKDQNFKHTGSYLFFYQLGSKEGLSVWGQDPFSVSNRAGFPDSSHKLMITSVCHRSHGKKYSGSSNQRGYSAALVQGWPHYAFPHHQPLYGCGSARLWQASWRWMTALRYNTRSLTISVD